jgi:hypothetical protein
MLLTGVHGFNDTTLNKNNKAFVINEQNALWREKLFFTVQTNWLFSEDTTKNKIFICILKKHRTFAPLKNVKIIL